MESCMKEEKELLMRVVREIRSDPERIPSNPRYIDKKKVITANLKISKTDPLSKLKQLQKQNQYFVLLAILLLRWWVTKIKR